MNIAKPIDINKKKFDVFWKMILNTEAKLAASPSACTPGITYLCVCLMINQISSTKITEDMKIADLMLASFK